MEHVYSFLSGNGNLFFRRKIEGSLRRMAVLAVCLVGLHATVHAQYVLIVSNSGNVRPTAGAGLNCTTERYLFHSWDISGLLSLTTLDSICLAMSWGDGLRDTLNLVKMGGIVTGTGSARNVNIPVNDQRISHDFAAKPTSCYYPVQGTLLLYVNGEGTPRFDSPTAVFPTPVWQRESEGPNGLQLINLENGNKIYYVCPGAPISIRFKNTTKLTCTRAGADDYDKNVYPRYTQYIYGYDDGANIIHDVELDSSPYTYPYTTPTPTPTQHPPSGNFSVNEDSLEETTCLITAPGTNTKSGDRFTILLKMWNICNPRDINAPLENADTVSARILVVQMPKSPKPDTVEFCYNDRNLPNINYSYTLTHNLTLAETGGDYKWYAWDPSGSPSDSVGAFLYTSTAKTFDPTVNAPVPYRLTPAVAGEYRYWVTYKYSPVPGPEDPCETKKTLIVWKIRETITPKPVLNTASDTVGCPNETIRLFCGATATTSTGSLPLGGKWVYEWAFGAGGAQGATLNPETSDGRYLDLLLPANVVAPTQLTINIRVRKRWKNMIVNTNSENNPCAASSFDGCEWCAGEWRDVAVTVNPFPVARLRAGADICDDETFMLKVDNVQGAPGSTSFDIQLNHNSTYATYSNAVQPIEIAPAVQAPGTVARYFIYRIKDNATGCVSVAPNTAPFTIPGRLTTEGDQPVTVVRRATLTPPTTSDPVNGQLLCENVTNQPATVTPAILGDVSHAGVDVTHASISGGDTHTPPAGVSRGHIYEWRWYYVDALTAGAHNDGTTNGSFTYNTGANTHIPPADGTVKRMRLMHRYTVVSSVNASNYCLSKDSTITEPIVIPNPVATVNKAASDTIICQGNSAGITVNATGYKTGNWTVNWTLTPNGGGTQTSGTLPTITNNGAGSGSAVLTLPASVFQGTLIYGDYTLALTLVSQNTTASCSTANTDHVLIKVLRTPTAWVDGAGTICEKLDYTVPWAAIHWDGDQDLPFAIEYTSSKTGATQHKDTLVWGNDWTVPAANIKTGSDVTDITIVAVSQAGCAGTVDPAKKYVITTVEKAEATILNPANDTLSLCLAAGNVVNLTANTPGVGYTGEWLSLNGGTFVNPLANPSNTFHIPSAFGVYTLIWKVTENTSTCAPNSDTLLIIAGTEAQRVQLASPAVTPAFVCGDSILLQAANVLLPWEKGGWSITDQGTGSGAPVTLTPLNATTAVARLTNPEDQDNVQFRYDIGLLYTSPLCPAHDTAVVVSFVGVPDLNVVTPLNDTICAGTSISKTLTDGKGLTAPSALFNWRLKTPATNIDSLVNTNVPTGATINFTGPDNMGSADVVYPFTVSAVRTRHGLTCADVDSFKVVVKPSPQILFDNAMLVCPDDSIKVKINLPASVDSVVYRWDNLSVVQTAGLEDKDTVMKAPPYSYAVIAGEPTTVDGSGKGMPEPNSVEITATIRGCSSSKSVVITVNPIPQVILTPDSAAYCPNQLINNVSAPAPPLITADVTGLVNFGWLYSGTHFSGLSSGSVANSAGKLLEPFTANENFTSANYTDTVRVFATGNILSSVSGKGCAGDTAYLKLTLKRRPDMQPPTADSVCAPSAATPVEYFSDIVPAYGNLSFNDIDSISWFNAGNAAIAGSDKHHSAGKSVTDGKEKIRDVIVPPNLTGVDITARIRVTAYLDGCAGDTSEFIRTALSLPVLDVAALDDSICPGAVFPQAVLSNFANQTADTVYWEKTVVNPLYAAIFSNLPADGHDLIPAFTAMPNVTGTLQEAVITVYGVSTAKPTGGLRGCVGPDSTFVLGVKPSPVLETLPLDADSTLCPGETFDAVELSSNTDAWAVAQQAATLYSWTVNRNDLGIADAGSIPHLYNDPPAEFPSFTGAVNVSGSVLNGLVKVTASLAGCKGDTVSFTRRLKPTPVILLPKDTALICPESNVPLTNIRTNVAGKDSIGVSWNLDNDDIEFPNAGGYTRVLNSGVWNSAGDSIPAFKANANPATQINPNPPDIIGVFTLRATVDGCTGGDSLFTVVIKSTPDIIGVSDLFLCDNVYQPSIHLEGSMSSGVLYHWKRTGTVINKGAPLPVSGDGDIPGFTTLNASNDQLDEVVDTFTIWSENINGFISGGCPGSTDTFTVTVGSVPKVLSPGLPMDGCAGNVFSPERFGIQTNASYTSADTLYKWKVVNVSPAWVPELNLPAASVTDTLTGSIPSFVPDTSRSLYTPNHLWGTTSYIARLEVWVELKGCSSSHNPADINIHPLPVNAIRPNVDDCVEDGDIKTYEAVNRNLNAEYFWDVEGPATGRPDTLPNPVKLYAQMYQFPTPAEAWEGNIVMREKNYHGCFSDTLRHHIDVVPAPVIFAGNDTIACAAQTLTLDGKLIRPDIISSPIVYEWYPMTYVLVDGNEATLHPTIKPGVSNITLYLRAYQKLCTSKRDTINITVKRTPDKPLVVDRTYCSSEADMSMAITNHTDPTDSIRWYRIDGVNRLPVDGSNDSATLNMNHAGDHPNAIPWASLIYTGALDEAQVHYGVYLISADYCVSDTAAAQLTVRKIPDTPLSDTTEYCRNGQFNFMLEAYGNNIRWYADTLVPPNPARADLLWIGDRFSAQNIPAGDTAFYITAGGQNGCASLYAEKMLRVHANPHIALHMPDSIGCADFLTEAENISAGTDATTLYILDWGDNRVDTILQHDKPAHTYHNDMPNDASLTLLFSAVSKINADENGLFCASGLSKTVIVYPSIHMTVNASTTVDCDQSEVPAGLKNAIHFSAYAPTTGGVFHWDFDGNGTEDYTENGTVSSPSHVYESRLPALDKYRTPDPFTSKVWVTTEHTGMAGTFVCRSDDSLLITLNPAPKAEYTIRDAQGLTPAWICSPTELTFDNLQWADGSPPDKGVNTPATQYAWSVDGVPNTGRDTVYRFDNRTYLPEDRMLILRALNEYGCRDTAIRTLRVMPFVSANFVVTDTSGCHPITLNFISTSQGAQEHKWFWDFAGEPQPADPADAAGINAQHTFDNPSAVHPQRYHVWLRTETGTISERCYGYRDTIITVYPVPTPAFDVLPPIQYYPDDVLTFNNQIPSPDKGELLYSWTVARQTDGVPPAEFSTAVNPPPYKTGDHHAKAWGSFDFTQNIVSSYDSHCPARLTLTVVIVPPDPVAAFDSVAAECQPYEVRFHNTSEFGNFYWWDFGDGASSTLENPVHFYQDAGVYTVTLIVTGDAINPDTVSRQIVVHPLPMPFFNVKPAYLWVGQAVYVNNLTSGATSQGVPYDVWFRWDWGDGSAQDTARQPEHFYGDAGTYDVTLTAGTYTQPECVSSFTVEGAVTLEIMGDIIFPNAFKPDPNGEPSDVIPNRNTYRNYLFFPPVLRPTREYHLSVYNRWGQLIFETDDPERGWTGYFQGKPCDEGVYIYKAKGVFETGRSFSTIGNVLLIR
ncbi:MAG: gliding motility-associated C-terminal domain-containing protein [Bacteroidales bacterium]|jgi:PKD repeat protein|nr:gliding motility-associated C-terminal domain-containing protein [Bacteroidales bacterium]